MSAFPTCASGIEVGEPHLFTASLAAVRRSAPFDRVLGSLHCLEHDGTIDYADRRFTTLPAAQLMRRYFASEPLPPASPLLRDRRILATPHIAGVTDVNYQATARYIADVISRLAQRRPLDRCVNWEAVASSFYA